MDSQQQYEINQPINIIKKEVHDVEITIWDSSEKGQSYYIPSNLIIKYSIIVETRAL